VITGTSRDGPAFATSRAPSQPGRAPRPRSLDPDARSPAEPGSERAKGKLLNPTCQFTRRFGLRPASTPAFGPD
jgi:hypothetical protein